MVLWDMRCYPGKYDDFSPQKKQNPDRLSVSGLFFVLEISVGERSWRWQRVQIGRGSGEEASVWM